MTREEHAKLCGNAKDETVGALLRIEKRIQEDRQETREHRNRVETAIGSLQTEVGRIQGRMEQQEREVRR